MDDPTRSMALGEPFLEIGGETKAPASSAFLNRSAEVIGSTAGYVRSFSLKETLSDADHVVRDNPLPAVGGAAAFGFLLGALLRRI